ncbi:MAG: heme NO-binding domain-containing protein [Bacteroidetes bacterium]|nr:heme NO-binding domain-containing protein [Bacteroidota bacterium]
MENQSRVHGSIFFLLKKFVIHNYSEAMWLQLNQESGIDETKFEMTHNYPLSDIEAIINRASVHTGFSGARLQETFGEYLVPDLFTLYKSYLNPAWKTFDVLEQTENVMHGAVRKLNSTATPPGVKRYKGER